METNICSIKLHELITPGSKTYFELRRGTYAYLEVGGTASVKCKKKVDKLRSGEVIIGRQFQINNTQEQLLQLRGFIFNSSTLGVNSNPFWICRNLQLHGAISDIFDHAPNFIQLSSQLSEHFPHVLKVMINNLRGNDVAVQPYRQDIGRIDKRLVMINRYIRDNFQKPLTLKDMANLISCNPIYLSNTYSKVFCISPMKYIQSLRMEKAKELLVKGTLNIGEIAEALGYVSASQFAELFKKYYQMTPSQYRIKHSLQKLNDTIQGSGD